MWQQRKGRRVRSPAPDEAEHSYEDASDFYSSRNLVSHSFRWLLTANARADMQLKIAESSLTKERNRVRNAIERQQKSLQSRSVALQSKLSLACPRKVPGKTKTTVGGPTPELARPRCPTPNGSVSIILPPSTRLPRITFEVFEDVGESLRSRSDGFFSRHLKETGEERRRSKQRGLCSVRVRVNSRDHPDEKRTMDYLQVPLRRSKNRTRSL
jgi:hypothetical protein